VGVEHSGEHPGPDHAGELAAGQPKAAIRREAGREDHGVEVLTQLVEAQVAPDLDVAGEAHGLVLEETVELSRDRLRVLMVGCDAVAHQAEW
jgi:hypothetical protein